MKKHLLTAAIFIAGLTNLNAQSGNFKTGAHVGIPVSSIASDFYNVNLGVDIAYLWNLSDRLQLGATSGLSYYIGKNDYKIWINGYEFEGEVENRSIIPLAGTLKYYFSDLFFAGGDLGYAFFLNGTSDTGSFYFQPKAGVNLKATELYLSYKGLSKGGETIGTINLGYAYNF